MAERRAASVASGSGSRPLAGARGWLITDDKVGMAVQARGVADALGLDYEHKQVSPTGLTKLLAPYARPSRAERLGAPGSLFAPPWPDVMIATGRLSIPYVRALKRLAGVGTFSVVLQDPKTGAGTADLVWVPEHDRLRGPNVVTTLTAPHSYSPARLAALRASVPAGIAALPAPRVAVILGGKNAVYKYTEAADQRLADSLASLAALGVSFMITPSRRSHRRLVDLVDRATCARPRILWDGAGSNPYADFLAHADLLVVTGDSVNMTGEACATGKPVYVFLPDKGSPKFARFHEGLRRHGATRPLPDRLTRLDEWSYEPLDSAAVIAAEIERRWQRRRELLPHGLAGGRAAETANTHAGKAA